MDDGDEILGVPSLIIIFTTKEFSLPLSTDPTPACYHYSTVLFSPICVLRIIGISLSADDPEPMRRMASEGTLICKEYVLPERNGLLREPHTPT